MQYVPPSALMPESEARRIAAILQEADPEWLYKPARIDCSNWAVAGREGGEFVGYWTQPKGGNMGATKYILDHPRTVSVGFQTMQQAADYLFSFRHSPDFGSYMLRDTESGLRYVARNSQHLNAVELVQV